MPAPGCASQAHGRACVHMTEPVRARQACVGYGSVRDMEFLALCRDTNFCVATWLGWDRLVLRHDMIFHVTKVAAVGASGPGF